MRAPYYRLLNCSKKSERDRVDLLGLFLRLPVVNSLFSIIRFYG